MTTEHKVAVVTGGASGIGEAICLYLARDGMDVAIWDVNGEAAENVAEKVREQGRRAVATTVDVSDRVVVLAATETARRELGAISVLVNCAGVQGMCAFQDLDDEAWDRVMDINLKGTFICTQAVLEDMLSANWGRIINISSSSAQAGSSHMVHYAASKGGVIAFTKALALELGPRGITVNNVPPGMVDTPMLRDLEATGRIGGGVEKIAETLPMRRVGRPEDMAAAVAFLASEDAGYITGHTLSVNGGRYMN